VCLTGYAYASHLFALWSLSRAGIPTLFRGDSHLLRRPGRTWRWLIKRELLRFVYRLPTGCLHVGKANYEYFKTFGVADYKLHFCPHSVDVPRFAEPH